MFKRIVKLSFEIEKIPDFLEIFEKSKYQIRNFNGCNHLELWQDETHPNVFFTYSYWDSKEDLEAYRNSELFKETWSATKILFNDKPSAWTIKSIAYLP